jgi:DNA-binding CsgD family transcriptional regulator
MEEVVDPRALGLAVRSALELLSRDAPIVLAVDDVQWLDSSSATSLVFGLRRVANADVLLLLARRSNEAKEASGLLSAIDQTRADRLQVGPLSLGAVQRLLQGRFGRTLPRPTLLRVHDVSGGNPFYALELVRALDPIASPDPTLPLPVPKTLEGLVGTRVRGLPTATRTALLLAAALERASPAQFQAAGIVADVLEPAVTADVIEMTPEAIRFTHPLLASVLYLQASDDERRRAHAAAAHHVDDDVARARHLALASDRPDADLAAAVEHAAATARSRGAAAAAAELGELAARLTAPADEDQLRRRLVQASRDHLAAGMKARAQELATDILEHAQPGSPRATVLTLLGEIEISFSSSAGALPYLYDALAEGPLAPELAFMVHELLAWALRGTDGLFAAEPHVRAAGELATSLGDPTLVARALALQAEIHLGLGRSDAFELAERAISLARSADDPTALATSREALGHCLFFGGRLAEAREILLELRNWAAQHDESALEVAFWYLGLLEYRAGRWQLARDYADRQLALSGDSDSPDALATLALVAAAVGDVGSARAFAERALAARADPPWTFLRWFHSSILGMLAHWSSDPVQASEQFETVAEEQNAAGGRSVLQWLFTPERIEALLALGPTEAAIALLEPWEAEARGLDLAWPLAEATRCRGFLAAARGDIEEATALLERAAAEHEAVGDPLGCARAQLALGAVQRRARQKRAAREAIEAAVAGFDDLGAAGWADKARAELGQIGGRRRTEGLTPAETRVATLVAEGRTNREVAAALFLGERTVESHLSHVYAKLGVRSRTELARVLGPAP